MGEEKGPNARRPSTLRCRSSSTSTSHLLIQTTTKQPIVSLNAQDTVAQALSTLSAARILSAPLVVGPPSLAFEGRPPVNSVAAFVGVADVVDALAVRERRPAAVGPRRVEPVRVGDDETVAVGDRVVAGQVSLLVSGHAGPVQIEHQAVRRARREVQHVGPLQSADGQHTGGIERLCGGGSGGDQPDQQGGRQGRETRQHHPSLPGGSIRGSSAIGRCGCAVELGG